MPDLTRKIIPASGLDSSSRSPLPRCLPNTRGSLVERIKSRLLPPSEVRYSALWLYGLPGSGKTAIAQTIAEQFRDTGKLGAAVFLSHLNTHFKKEFIFPTIAQQLAGYHPAYRRFLDQLISSDPTIFDQDLSTQFRKFIAEPFASFKSQQSPVIASPLLIVLDGLDRCDQRTATNILELICTPPARNSPLVWMVCSRPGQHLSATFSNIRFADKYAKEEVAPASQDDILSYLHSRFQEFNHLSKGSSPRPTSAMLRTITTASSGSFRFAFVATKLVGESYSPQQQLSALLDFIQRTNSGGVGSHPLDLIYNYTLSAIPGSLQAFSPQILGVLAYHSGFFLPVQALSNFF